MDRNKFNKAELIAGLEAEKYNAGNNHQKSFNEGISLAIDVVQNSDMPELVSWVLFETGLPTTEIGEQIDILFGHPKWATFMRGMYSHYPDLSLRERLSEYNSETDRFMDWESMMPTYWYKLPEKP